MKLLYFGLGFALGLLLFDYSDGQLNRLARAKSELIAKQAETWISAHKARDREDEKIRQDMEKILNRIELMGAIPRDMKNKPK